MLQLGNVRLMQAAVEWMLDCDDLKKREEAWLAACEQEEQERRQSEFVMAKTRQKILARQVTPMCTCTILNCLPTATIDVGVCLGIALTRHQAASRFEYWHIMN